MNILILSWRSPGHPNEGGAEKVTFEHAKAWVSAGHEVTWFSSKYPGSKSLDLLDGVKFIRKGEYVLGVRLNAFWWYLFGNHKKFDLVMDEFHGIPFFTPLFIRVKKFAFIHEVAKEVWKLNPWPTPFNIFPTVLGTYMEPFIFKFIYRNVPFVTVSESTREELIKWDIPSENITIIKNGVTVINSTKKKSKDKIAMYLGAMSEDKGIFDAIKIFSEIEKKDTNWKYWVVGKGTPEYISKLESESGELGIDGKIVFYGHVGEAEKFDLLKEATVLVNPSIREGWGLVNIESSAMGTPVFGYKVSGMKDSVKDGKTGILVRLHDTKNASAEIIKLIKDKNRYLKYSNASIAWSKNFSWEKSNKESLEFIESL